MLQRLPLEQLHGEERPTFVFVNVVDGADVGVIERRGGAGLALEAFECGTVPSQLFGEEFERDRAAQMGILGAINHAHAAGARLFQGAVMSHRLAGHGRGNLSACILVRCRRQVAETSYRCSEDRSLSRNQFFGL